MWGAYNINGAIIFYICATVRTQILVIFIEWLESNDKLVNI